MPGELSTWGAKVCLDYITGRALNYPAAFSTYLALCTANIDDDTTMSGLPELTDTNYQRKAITWVAATNVNPPVISNSALVTFPGLAADMPSSLAIVAAALVTTSSGTTGDYLAWWTLSNPITLLTGQQLQISAGKLTMTLT
jgi:hypothetical protein